MKMTFNILNYLKNKEIITNIGQLINLILFLLVLNLFSQNLGCFSYINHRFYGFIALIVFIIFNLPNKIKIFNKTKIFIGSGLIVLSFISIFAFYDNIFWLFSIPIFIFGFNILLCGLNCNLLRVQIYLLTSLLYTILYLICISLPWIWYLFTNISLGFSKGFNDILPQPVLLGPSASGFWILASFGIYLFSYYILILTKKAFGKLKLLIGLSGLIILNLVYLIIQNIPKFVHQSAIGIVNSQIIFFILGAIFLWFYTMKTHIVEYSGIIEKKFLYQIIPIGTLIGIFIFLLTLYPISLNQDAKDKTILFANEGYVDWDKPVFGKYGPYQMGLFGALLEYLESAGYRCKVWNGKVTKKAFKGVNTFIIINPQKKWKSYELKAIWEFVKKGGSLLVLGDHTDLLGIMGSLNQLLTPANIEFKFDSGYPCKHMWKDCYQFLIHPICQGIKYWNEVVISIGASLSITPPAFPIIVGRYGFSDIGNPENVQGAYLGNYTYEPGEQLGDVILAAGRYYGKGKVLVFGDTSSFQNTALSYSFIPFVQNIFNYLNTKDVVNINYLKLLIVLFLLILGYIFYKHTNLSSLSLLILSLIMLISFFTSSILNSIVIRNSSLKGEIAWIDISHGERCELASLQSNSIGGLIATLLRCDYLPILLRDSFSERLSNSDKGDLLILISPTKKFTVKEINVIKEFMKRGGLVTLCVGWEGREASKPLLDTYGIDIIKVPLGPVPIIRHTQKEVQFVEAWPIVSTLNKLLASIRNVQADVIHQSPQVPFPKLPVPIQNPLIPEPVSSMSNSPYSPDINPNINHGIPNIPIASLDPGKSILDGKLLQPLLEQEQRRLKVFYQTEDGLPLIVFKPDGKGGLLVIGDRHFLGDANLENMKYYREGNILFLKKIFDTLKNRMVKK